MINEKGQEIKKEDNKEHNS